MKKESMALLKYVARCPECQVDIPVVAQGKKDQETYCYRCARTFKGYEVSNGVAGIKNDIKVIEALLR